MRNTVLCVIVGLMAIMANAQEFQFETASIDYGKIKQGADGVRVFEFINIGTEPLIIKDIKSTCGCTVPKKPEKPIMPGEKGQIEVSYDTRRVGGFSKAITIISNAKASRKMLKIKGHVEKEKEKDRV
ncbi:Protein of unknown function [Tenacibaculum mesophilum]|uniref:DUF1573 domain-containing protein n=1 Tax=Tenacibaculum mesophilum TaxID=104268 RepID=A0ABM7CGU5_9FLAO|nr:DUF1573 domain-containing protein [Tenacibaculum mesophilum]AZJ33000.1 DUF1573 domain-containing protein [Tenacibaculum mesophilum]QFS28250.1 DUF1573 domain-containing protein [Tenacibaculum mesophilum]SHF69485.1 Protein of unknown function [Tenacibaculum mesophilum]